jgi:hypothetical protein
MHDAKIKLGHGNFLNWLKDSRVRESSKTAERLLKVYKNFRQVLNYKGTETTLFESLNVTKLLELTNLPEHFYKSVELFNDDGHPEIVDVIDENKLEQFLERFVEKDGQKVKVKDLSSADLKKVVDTENNEIIE